MGLERRLLVTDGIYVPDVWTTELLEGVANFLECSSVAIGIVAEVGVGSGIIPVYLDAAGVMGCPTYVGLDINPVACAISRLNVGLHASGLEYRSGVGANLFDELGTLSNAPPHLVVANLPQVPALAAEVRNANDYYDPNAYPHLPREIVAAGLGLLYECIRRARQATDCGGTLITTFARRCGEHRFNGFFDELGVQFEVLRTKRVVQDRTTRIESLCIAEEVWSMPFEFYASLEAQEPIVAREARSRIAKGLDVYFDLQVVAVDLASGKQASSYEGNGSA
jgi:hypothetical protein